MTIIEAFNHPMVKSRDRWCRPKGTLYYAFGLKHGDAKIYMFPSRRGGQVAHFHTDDFEDEWEVVDPDQVNKECNQVTWV